MAISASYELLIIKGQDGNSLIVANLTGNALLLSPLRLGDGNGVLMGSAWGIDNLADGICVGTWK